jgi:hypothetical protein
LKLSLLKGVFILLMLAYRSGILDIGAMMERLFDIDEAQPKSRTPLVELTWQRWPVLAALEIEVDSRLGSDYPLADITLKPGALLYESGTSFYTGIEQPDDDLEDDQKDGWSEVKTDVSQPLRGFIWGAFTDIDGLKEPILHIEMNCTDADMRLAVPLSGVATVAKYSAQACEVYLAYQHALADGDTYFWQRHNGWPTESCLTPEELEPYISTYWPEPTTVYTADQ